MHILLPQLLNRKFTTSTLCQVMSYMFLILFQLLLVRQPLGGRLCPRTHVGGNLRVPGRTARGPRLSQLLVVFLLYRPQVFGGFRHCHGLGLLQLPWIARSTQSMHELFTSYRVFSSRLDIRMSSVNRTCCILPTILTFIRQSIRSPISILCYCNHIK